jgi:hypothetical protein
VLLGLHQPCQQQHQPQGRVHLGSQRLPHQAQRISSRRYQDLRWSMPC